MFSRDFFLCSSSSLLPISSIHTHTHCNIESNRLPHDLSPCLLMECELRAKTRVWESKHFTYPSMAVNGCPQAYTSYVALFYFVLIWSYLMNIMAVQGFQRSRFFLLPQLQRSPSGFCSQLSAHNLGVISSNPRAFNYWMVRKLGSAYCQRTPSQTHIQFYLTRYPP